MTESGKNPAVSGNSSVPGSQEGHRTYFYEGEDALHWHHNVRLIRNPVLWKELIITIGLPFLIIAGIVTLFARTGDRAGVLLIFLILLAGIFLVAFVIIALLSRHIGGGIDAAYTLNAAGIEYEGEEAARMIHRSTLLLSLISGAVGAAGTSLIALSQEKNFIAREDVHRVKIYRGPRVVYLLSRESTPPIALYCPPDLFDQILEIFKKNVRNPTLKT
jgi:hypothetical protein